MAMAKKSNPTLRQIAELTGFSQASISMILSGRDDVSFSDDTVKAVRDAAAHLGYFKKRPAGSQRHGKGLVAVLCPNISNPYYSTLVQAIEQAAWKDGYRVITLNDYRSPEVEAKNLELIARAGVSGVIFTLWPLDRKALEKVAKTVPAVAIGDKGSGYNIDTVEMDNYGAAVLVAKHLIGLGHERIAYVSTTLDEVNVIRTQRLKGLEDTLAAELPSGVVTVFSRDITPSEELEDLFVEHEVGYRLTESCLSDEGVTAFVGVNDMVAYGIIDAIVEAGFSIPRDYSVCGFDNVFPSRLSSIGLTTVDNYIVEKGHNAFSMLAARMAKADDGAGPDGAEPGAAAGGRAPDVITRVEYPPRLIVRGSTGPARSSAMADGRRKRP